MNSVLNHRQSQTLQNQERNALKINDIEGAQPKSFAKHIWGSSNPSYQQQGQLYQGDYFGKDQKQNQNFQRKNQSVVLPRSNYYNTNNNNINQNNNLVQNKNKQGNQSVIVNQNKKKNYRNLGNDSITQLIFNNYGVPKQEQQYQKIYESQQKPLIQQQSPKYQDQYQRNQENYNNGQVQNNQGIQQFQQQQQQQNVQREQYEQFVQSQQQKNFNYNDQKQNQEYQQQQQQQQQKQEEFRKSSQQYQQQQYQQEQIRQNQNQGQNPQFIDQQQYSSQRQNPSNRSQNGQLNSVQPYYQKEINQNDINNNINNYSIEASGKQNADYNQFYQQQQLHQQQQQQQQQQHQQQEQQQKPQLNHQLSQRAIDIQNNILGPVQNYQEKKEQLQNQQDVGVFGKLNQFCHQKDRGNFKEYQRAERHHIPDDYWRQQKKLLQEQKNRGQFQQQFLGQNQFQNESEIYQAGLNDVNKKFDVQLYKKIYEQRIQKQLDTNTNKERQEEKKRLQEVQEGKNFYLMDMADEKIARKKVHINPAFPNQQQQNMYKNQSSIIF